MVLRNPAETSLIGAFHKVLETRVDDLVRPESRHPVKMSVRGLDLFYGDKQALHAIDLDIHRNEVLALVGPSGCGKTTLLRCLNRTNDIVETARLSGLVEMDGIDVYAKEHDPATIRGRFGWVAQKPNPFPLSVFDNIAYGIRIHNLISNKRELSDRVEQALRQADLWEETKDDLDQDGLRLSGGQQQRLCIARAIAYEPEVILMDEPCSAIDPIATAHIEDLIKELARDFTIVIITHNLQQAARISHQAAFLHLGHLIEADLTQEVFSHPRDERTRAFLMGQFG